jgi:hypothetical protein
MPKSAPSTAKLDVTEKKATSAAKSRSRVATRAALPSSPTETVNADGLAPLIQRLSDLEEKVTASFATLASEMQALQAKPVGRLPEGDTPSETVLPIIADLIRRNLVEHLTPITAALKRLEERIGFVSNRLKNSPGGQERQKPWRHDQQRHPRHRPPNGPRPGQGQPWSPPSAASVQGHFAPRLIGREGRPGAEDEE